MAKASRDLKARARRDPGPEHLARRPNSSGGNVETGEGASWRPRRAREADLGERPGDGCQLQGWRCVLYAGGLYLPRRRGVRAAAAIVHDLLRKAAGAVPPSGPRSPKRARAQLSAGARRTSRQLQKAITLADAQIMRARIGAGDPARLPKRSGSEDGEEKEPARPVCAEFERIFLLLDSRGSRLSKAGHRGLIQQVERGATQPRASGLKQRAAGRASATSDPPMQPPQPTSAGALREGAQEVERSRRLRAPLTRGSAT